MPVDFVGGLGQKREVEELGKLGGICITNI